MISLGLNACFNARWKLGMTLTPRSLTQLFIKVLAKFLLNYILQSCIPTLRLGILNCHYIVWTITEMARSSSIILILGDNNGLCFADCLLASTELLQDYLQCFPMLQK